MRKYIFAILACLLLGLNCRAQVQVKRVLFIGDSMTGWLSERMEAYGTLNGFSVSAVIWDGSTLSKWAKAGKIPSFISTYKPDLVMVSLGLNELLVRNPGATLSAPLAAIQKQIGDLPYVWIGPPVWPGKGDGAILNKWMEANISGNGHYFNSSSLQLPRQSKTNPHPTRPGCATWMDAIMQWLPEHVQGLPATIKTPPTGQMKRGSVYIYRRMNQNL